MNDKKESVLESLAETLEIDVDTLKEILLLFFDNMPGQIQTMRDDLAQNDFKSIHVISHTLKGTAANLRYNEISETASAIEILAVENVTTAEAYEALFNKLSLLLAHAKMQVFYK
jgi:HPt (histidine-containing phosphotransfer) domain-containing protein